MMYVIVIYDVGEKQVSKVHKFLKKRLTWIQNSVFEGELSKSQFVEMSGDLKKMIKSFQKSDPEGQYSTIIFHMPYKGALERTVFGEEKNPIDNFV